VDGGAVRALRAPVDEAYNARIRLRQRSEQMPQVFRIMRRDADGLPTVQQASSALGVRPGVDISLDVQGNVIVNGEGMSVNPGWRMASILRIPRHHGDPPRLAGGRDVKCQLIPSS
jgi:hypothetical protein